MPLKVKYTIAANTEILVVIRIARIVSNTARTRVIVFEINVVAYGAICFGERVLAGGHFGPIREHF